jgi:tetratricopeptide (TPR) repeat protein/transcriptional regulator with XRE-family HTH domain
METVTQEPFGQLVWRFRRAAGLTQDELAERAGVSARAISDIERGVKHRPRTDTIQLLLEALEVPVDQREAFRTAARRAGPEAGSPEDALLPSAAGHGTAEDQTGRDLPIGSYLGSLAANRVVGREAELNRALELIDSAIGGTGRLLLLSGEPGAGKTRLAQEITLYLHQRDFLITAGRCYESQQAVAFYPFIEALASLYAAAPVDIRHEVPRRWSYLARLLPALGLPVSDYTGPHDQQRLLWTATGFVQALARRKPVALLLDDLHWADAASLELLQHLARHAGGDRVLLLGTYRDGEVNRRHPLEGALRDLQREGLIARLEVRSLGRAQTGELIATVMGEEEISDDLIDLIHRRTEGNPFFVRQVLHAMVERGDMYWKDGHWDRKRIDEIEVPESVRSVVGQRLSRLKAETQEILLEAAVLGQTFSFDDLLIMSGRVENELELALDEASAAGMVRETSRNGYGFDHALTQGALSAELPSRRRRRLHLAAGEAIEALPDRTRQRRAAELAWHFLEGDDAERARRWSVIAGDAAEHVFAHSDAEQHYRTALQLAEEEENRAQEIEAREKLASVLSLMARHDEALEEFERAVHWYHEHGDFEGEIRAMAGVAWILFELGRRDEGIERLRPVLERWEREPVVSAGAASLHVAMGNLYWHAGWLDNGLRLLERAVELATAVDHSQLLGVAESRRALLLEHLGRSDEALAAYSRSIPLLEATGDLQTLSRSFNNRSHIYGERGQPAEAWNDLEQALEVARQLGDPARLAWALGVLARSQWTVDGDWTGVEPYVDEIMELERQIRGTRSSALLASAVWLRLVAGGQASALQALERLADEGAQDGDVALWQFAQAGLAEWDMLQGRGGRAVERYEAVLEDATLESQYRPLLERRLVNAYLECGDMEHAEALSTGWQQEENGLGGTLGRPDWLIVRARLRAAQGRWEEARSDIEEAIDISSRFRVALMLADTMHAYGQILVQHGEPDMARERFKTAVGMYRHIGAQPYVERTERALAALE